VVILYLILVYVLVGVVFAGIFLLRLIHKLDESAIGTSWTFKLMIFPGCVVFWPLLLGKYLRASKENSHD
jgi:hypothetical protein